MGHRGASALAPENTPEAFALAVELGCDMLEFDVLALADGTIVVAHDRRASGAPGVVTLDAALAFCAEELPGVGLQVDLKRRGIEAAVVDALRAPRCARALVGQRLRRRRASAHRRARAGAATLVHGAARPVRRLQAPAARAARPGGAQSGRRRPAAPRASLAGPARATALTLHHSVASEEAIARAHQLQAPVYVWTVDDPALAERLVRWGADGIITNDPRVFTGLTT